MDRYREGLAHGYEDKAAQIRKILDRDISDARKLEEIELATRPMVKDEAK